MWLLLLIFAYITVCESILVENRSVWEVRQYINSLGVVAPNAASAGELPYLVIIVDERIVMCNGVIVTYEFVLASSICMKPEYYISNTKHIPEINVLAGVYDTTDPKVDEFIWIVAKDVICEASSNSHIVLIHLSQSLNMTGLISGITLPDAPYENEDDVDDEKNCFVAGYIFKTKNVPIYQQKEVVEIYTPKQCRERFGLTNSDDTKNSVCLVTNSTAEQNKTMAWDCEVDDGRIAFCEKTLVGFITKPLYANCTSKTPFLFVDVGIFKEFFFKQMLFDDNKQFIGGIERSFGKKHFYSFENNSNTLINCSYIWLNVLFIFLFCFNM